ncbi:MAG: hypothetical protein WC738_04270 [Candidatus Omnitrophota bacterium]|jgi:hypothetical protein
MLRRKQPEAHLLRKILLLLKLKGLYIGKVKTKGSTILRGGARTFIKDQLQMRGLPDAFAFDGRIMYAIETKVKPNKPTEEQVFFSEMFHHPPYRVYLLAYDCESVVEYIEMMRSRYSHLTRRRG